jgi:hypothetical protein
VPHPWRNRGGGLAFSRQLNREIAVMKGILLWLLGVPIPIIILIYLLT